MIDLTKKKILITGAHGFLGSYLVDNLLNKRGVPKENLFLPTIEELDLRKWENCQEAVKGRDIIIHLAAKTGGIGLNIEKPGELFYDNLIMGIQLMEAARQAGAEKFVALATVCSYPKFTPVPFKEENLWNGYPEETNAPYGLAKRMLLVQAGAYRRQYGFNSICLFPVNMYGPGDCFDLKSAHVIPSLIRKIYSAKKEKKDYIDVWGTGNPTREFLHARDGAEGIILAAEKYDKPEPINLGSGMEISIKDLVILISKIMNFNGEIRWDSSKPDGQPRRCLDTSKTEKELGFKAKTVFEDGIKETIDWYISKNEQTQKNNNIKKYIPQFEPWLGEEEVEEVSKAIRENWITAGPRVKEFENKIAGLCQVKRAIACCNGTQALYLGLKILGIGEGDEVIVPDFTFIASANAVVLTGARPVFVDIDAKTFNIDSEAIEKSITEKTKAIMPVHIFGQPADMDKIIEIAKRRSLLVIEDAAQGIGVKFRGKPVAGFGDVGCLSFYADKTMTTGEGGMVLTNNDDLAEKCVILLNQGRMKRGWYFHEKIGYNFRLTDLQAAVGLAQLKKLPEIIERKKRNEKLYRQYLANLSEVELPYIDQRGFNVSFRVCILVKDPGNLCDFLEKQGIGTKRFFYPLHLQPCYDIKGDFPNSVNAYERGVSLPSSVNLKEEEIKYVCDKIKEFYRG